MGVPEREEREQGIENLLEKMMTEDFPNLVLEINITSPRGAESPKQEESKQAHTKTHHN